MINRRRTARKRGIVHSIRLCVSRNMKRKVSQVKSKSSSEIRILTVKLSVQNKKNLISSVKLSITIRKEKRYG